MTLEAEAKKVKLNPMRNSVFEKVAVVDEGIDDQGVFKRPVKPSKFKKDQEANKKPGAGKD